MTDPSDQTPRERLTARLREASGTLAQLLNLIDATPGDGVPDRATIVGEYSLCTSALRLMESAKEGLSTALVGQMLDAGDTEMQTPEWTVKLQNTRQSKLVPERLIAAGVDPDTIKAATVETVSKPFVRLYPRNANTASPTGE